MKILISITMLLCSILHQNSEESAFTIFAQNTQEMPNQNLINIRHQEQKNKEVGITIIDLMRRETVRQKMALFRPLFGYFLVRSATTNSKISLNRSKNASFLCSNAPVASSLINSTKQNIRQFQFWFHEIKQGRNGELIYSLDRDVVVAPSNNKFIMVPPGNYRAITCYKNGELITIENAAYLQPGMNYTLTVK